MYFGIGSFAYRYAVGFSGCVPRSPMSPSLFIRNAAEMGFDTAQLCENLCYADLPMEKHQAFAREAHDLGLRIELGMNGITSEQLLHHLTLCQIYDSLFLRFVTGKNLNPEAVLKILSEVLPRFEQAGVKLGLENHFDLSTQEIAWIIQELNSPFVGAVFDTTNSIGFIETPDATLKILAPNIVSAHIKDFCMEKQEASYVMSGRILGEGSLPIDQIFRRLSKCERLQSIVMELTIRRSPLHGPDEAAQAESPIVAENATRFLRIAKNYF